MPRNSLAAEWPFLRCVRWGLAMGCGYAILAVAAGQALGSDFGPYYGLDVGQVILFDLLGGVLGGVAVGLLMPRVSGPLGYIVLAQLSLLPAYALFALSAPDRDGIALIDGVAAAAIVGLFVGLGLWRRYGRASAESNR